MSEQENLPGFLEWMQDRISLPDRELTVQDDGFKSIIFTRERKRKPAKNWRIEQYDNIHARGSDASDFLRRIADSQIERWGFGD